VACIELGALLEPLAGLEMPRRGGHGDVHGVARLDLEHGLELAREAAVQRPPLERELVLGH
jgi:hypothetical protein